MGRYTYKLKTIQIKVSEPPEKNIKIGSSEVAAKLLYTIYNGLDDDQEHFVVLFLNAKNCITGFKVLFSGSQTGSLIDTRIIFRNAILFGATAVILSHNHPSGDLEPSNEDISITKKCIEVGKLLDVQVLDHIIISQTGWFSFREKMNDIFLVPKVPVPSPLVDLMNTLW